MTIKAKSVVKNKYWILEDDGCKIGTIQASRDGVVLVKGECRSKYSSIRVLEKIHNVKFVKNDVKSIKSNSVYDYPSAVTPYNAIYDLRLRLPLYTTGPKSKSYYCAGYYLIKYGTEWTSEFCPKKIILDRNPFLGPFKSEKIMFENLESLTTHK